MKIQLHKNSIVLMVGPSHCGKSRLAAMIRDQADTLRYSAAVVSSDEWRRQLLGTHAGKHDNSMMRVSEQAFNMLQAEVINRTSYPVNTDIVIVDSTGLSQQFRQSIIDIGKQNHYRVVCILFNYTDRNDYFQFVDESINPDVIRKHINRLNKYTMGEIKKRDFCNIIRINKLVDSLELEVIDSSRCLKVDDDDYVVIGDIHGCIAELKQLLSKIGNRKIILLGDYLDKNSIENIHDTVRFIYDNKEKFIVLRGNHERFVLNFWQNPDSTDPSIIDQHFISCRIEDVGFREMVQNLYENSYDWVETRSYIVTHSPCQKKYLGKSDHLSLRMMRNLRHTNTDLRELLRFLRTEDNSCYPKHIFGHIAFDKVYKGKSWVALDTGAVYGGSLSSMDLLSGYIDSVPSQKYTSGTLNTYSEIAPKRELDSTLVGRERAIVKSIVNNNIIFLSGTMSPADKLGDDLESLEWALDYYKRAGISEVVFQPKAMGSRAQVYASLDPSMCKVVSRRGFVVKGDFTPIYQQILDRLNIKDETLAIVDGELMPWKLLGDSLISRTFNSYLTQSRAEFSSLHSIGFYDAIDSITPNPEFNQLSKADFIKKHKHHVYQLNDVYYQTRKHIYRDGIKYDVMEKQIQVHGGDSHTWYYPFSILKIGDQIYGYGADNYFMFSLLNDTPQHLVPTDISINAAIEMYNEMIGNNLLEGVVVKPRIITKGIAPYLKVRNRDYLTIVYGPDYLCETKYQKLLDRKRINSKIRKSITDFDLGLSMLTGEDTTHYAIKKVVGDQVESKFDPRL